MINDLINELKQYGESHFVPIIESPADELLKDFVYKRQPHSILEIGTAIGYSALLMLSVAPDDCNMLTVDVNCDRLSIAEHYIKKAGLSERVRIVEEDANYLITLLEDKYDFIFLDGPKGHYETMLPYLIDLLNDGGMIFVDDVGYHGWVDDGQYPKHKHRTIITNMRSFIKKVSEDKNLKSQRIDVGQGVLVIEKC